MRKFLKERAMPIDPQARAVLEAIARAEAEGRPRTETLEPDAARDLYLETRAAVTPEAPDVAHCEDAQVPGPGGEIPVRYYRPAGSMAGQNLPVLVYYHGGGWVFGDLDSHDVVCRGLANAGRFAVCSVDYRMGPEDKFPAAVEDAKAVVDWLAAGAGGRAVDASRLAVGGDSAGGNLAAVVALLAREKGPAIAYQALIYPATSMLRDTPSHAEFGEDHLLTSAMQIWCQNHYLRGPEDKTDWRASPLLAEDLTGLAPAYVLTAGFDPLRDEAKAYAERLRAAGVSTTYRCFEGQIHGFITMGKVIDAANEAIAETAGQVAAALV